MTITSQITSRGKAIHHLSLSDLVQVVESGERLRAVCPVHGGDHQRSLSIDRATGWGFCHCCHATVLVEALSSSLAFVGEGRWLRKRADACRHPTTTTPDWQRDEVAALQAAFPLMQEALASSRRAQRYLDERGIPLVSACAAGVGYLSRAVWEKHSTSEAQHLLKRWIGRILFPLTSPYGRGFIGRTLLRWEPGMDENTHKALLDRPGAPRRWIKTNPAGWFGGDVLKRGEGPLILVEGGFDRLALLSAGMPAESVLALVGTAARPSWLRWLAPQLQRVVLALDADSGGEEAMARLAGEFQEAGLAVSLCPPPADQWGKDWSERWRRLGPQSIFPLYEALARQLSAQKGGGGR
jgi:Toprim domain-containing protein